MAVEGGNIIRNIFGKSYKEAESIIKDASKGALDFKSTRETTFHGKNGGKKFNEYQAKKDETLLVVKVEGPLDDNGRKVEEPKEGVKYWFKATFNRSASKSEYKKLAWLYKINGMPIPWFADYSSLSGNTQTIQVKIPCHNMRVYAYFKNPIDEVSVEVNLTKEEIIIIIGTEQHSTNIANKLMFGGEAVRKVRTKYSNYPFLKIALFTDGYSEAQLSAITNSVLLHNKNATVIRVNSISDIINIINFGFSNSTPTIDKLRKVKEIYAYSHGYVRSGTNEGVIAFGYEGKNAIKQELDSKTFSQINPTVFLEKNATIFYSYACRTGIGTSSETATDPMKNNSLAQKMANKGRITVYAYMRRSLYEDAWGTQTHRDIYASDNDAGDSNWEDFKTDIKDFFKSDPKDMSSYNKYRKKEIKIDKAIWNPDGAYLDVKAGAWPVGVPSTYDKYLPK